MVINASLRGLLLDLRSKRRGLVVVGEQQCSMESQACVEIANTLGWPLVTDALSGTLSAFSEAKCLVTIFMDV